MSLGNLGIPGRNLLPYRSGYGAQVIAGVDVRTFGIPGGATIDWSTFSALGSDLTLIDTELMRAGWRYARFGQVMCRINNGAANVLTIGGGATGGNFTISPTNTATGASSTQTTANIPFGASPLQVKTALEALFNVGTGNIVVTGALGGPYYITPSGILGTTTFTASAAGLTGGTPTAVFTTGAGGIPRAFGPFDPSATGSGRDVLVPGDCFILNRTKVMAGSLQLPLQDDMHTGECVVGGRVWGAKIIMTSGTHSLAVGPTVAEVRVAFPSLEMVFV